MFAGASMVSSSQVFAGAGSVGAGQLMGAGMTPPPNSQVVDDKRSATWQIAAPNVSCSSGTMQVASYAVGRALSGNVSVLIVAPSGFGTNGYVAGASTATFTAVGAGPGNSPFRKGDAFEVTWYVRYSCTLNGVVTGCKLVDYTYGFVNQANGNPNWQPMPGTPFASTPRPCAL